MAIERIQAHCPRCRHKQLFKREGINHFAHLVLSIVTLGLWAISWVSVIIGHRHRPFYCDQCGFRLFK